MKKCLFFCVLLLLTVSAFAQRRPAATKGKSRVNLISSEKSVGIKGNDVIKVYRGTFQQEFSKLSSDSAYFYTKNNAFDAFGHVVINQGDTLNIYADKLNYNGNTHTAILTDNVRMVDKDATLSTNYLTYNTATRIGTYTGGGKLVNKTNTLVSKNGYYFAFSRDAYFRYNVVLTTNDAVIKTDTLRYNSGSRIAYFYGPTNIYGNKNKDTLYTENGTYNTVTEQAFFGKRNRYAQGTKTLKGDSLFYDRLKGYGRAVKNITFNDNEQKITMKGNLGTYYNADERTVVTQNAYVIFVTEEQDSTKTDSAAAKPADSLANKAVKVAANKKETPPAAKVTTAASTRKSADVPAPGKADLKPALPKTKPHTHLDSVYMAADTLETQILTFKNLKLRQEAMRPGRLKDSLAKIVKEHKVPQYTQSTAKHIYKPPLAGIPADTTYLHRFFFGKSKPVPLDTTAKKKPAQLAKKSAPAKVRKPLAPDSVSMTTEVNLSDTARIRVVSAHHHALLFKSNLQAKADSMFYSYSDSIIRCYVQPMMWTQGSQLSGDTIYLQLKNKKLNNIQQFPNAFVVNIEGTDSTNFNQVAGKKMRAFFVNNKMSQMYVDGNAESIYFARDSGKVSNMVRSLSSRIKVDFKDNNVTNIMALVKPEYRYGSLAQFKDDEKILKGFIWKPKDRPVSKEAVITAYSRRQAAARLAAKNPAAKAPPGKKPTNAAAPGSKPATGGTASAGTNVKAAAGQTGAKTASTDSTATAKPGVNKAAADTTRANPQPVKPAGNKPAVKDSVKKP